MIVFLLMMMLVTGWLLQLGAQTRLRWRRQGRWPGGEQQVNPLKIRVSGGTDLRTTQHPFDEKRQSNLPYQRHQRHCRRRYQQRQLVAKVAVAGEEEDDDHSREL